MLALVLPIYGLREFAHALKEGFGLVLLLGGDIAFDLQLICD